MTNKQYPSRFKKSSTGVCSTAERRNSKFATFSAWNGVEFPKFINLKALISCLEKSYTGPCFRPVKVAKTRMPYLLKTNFNIIHTYTYTYEFKVVYSVESSD